MVLLSGLQCHDLRVCFPSGGVIVYTHAERLIKQSVSKILGNPWTGTHLSSNRGSSSSSAADWLVGKVEDGLSASPEPALPDIQLGIRPASWRWVAHGLNVGCPWVGGGDTHHGLTAK